MYAMRVVSHSFHFTPELRVNEEEESSFRRSLQVCTDTFVKSDAEWIATRDEQLAIIFIFIFLFLFLHSHCLCRCASYRMLDLPNGSAPSASWSGEKQSKIEEKKKGKSYKANFELKRRKVWRDERKKEEKWIERTTQMPWFYRPFLCFRIAFGQFKNFKASNSAEHKNIYTKYTTTCDRCKIMFEMENCHRPICI